MHQATAATPALHLRSFTACSLRRSALLQALPVASLTKLSLMRPAFTEDGVAMPRAIAQLSSLKHVTVEKQWPSRVGQDGLTAIGQLAQLTSRYLCGLGAGCDMCQLPQQLTLLCDGNMEALSRLTALRQLELKGGYIATTATALLTPLTAVALMQYSEQLVVVLSL